MSFHREAVLGDRHPVPDITYATISARDADTDWHSDPENIDKIAKVTTGPVYYFLANNTPTWIEITTTVSSTLAGVLIGGNTTGGSDIVVDTGDVVTLTDAPAAGTAAANKDYADGIGSTIRITGNTTLALTPKNVFCDTDGGAIALGLPAGVAGIPYRIVNAGSSSLSVTITPDGVELLLGENSSFTLTDGDVLIIVYDDTEGWY